MPDPSPLYLNLDNVYQAQHLALPWGDVVEPGVVFGGAPSGVDPLAVGPLTPASMGVQVQPGAIWIKNQAADDAASYYQGGAWRCVFLTGAQVPITAAHATLGRLDAIVAEVLDSQFGVTGDIQRLRAIAGTPAASPAAPSTPRNAQRLAVVTVDPAVTSIVAGKITDQRVRAMIGGRAGPVVGFEAMRTTGTSRADGALIVISPSEAIPPAATPFANGWTNISATGGWRCDVPGLYQVLCQMGWANSGAGARFLEIQKNGATTNYHTQQQAASTSRNHQQQCSGPIRCVAGDLLTMAIRQDSGSTLAEAADGTVRMAAWRIGS